MQTLALVQKAADSGVTQAELTRELKLSDSALSQAKARGRLSPTLAGRIAERLGLDPLPWIALAALEAEKKDRTIDGLRRRIVANLRI
ncbi:MAG: hypothetical protein JSR38_15335 [Proteobacteria bacterium]|nr:hypothetical protein [Pseudomonadota bacterium]